MKKLCPMTFNGYLVANATPGSVIHAGDLDCVGSRCALWDAEPDLNSRVPATTGRGRCGLGKGDNFDDPAQTPKED